MDSQEKASNTGSASNYVNATPVRRLLRDAGIGCILGSLVGIAFHLITHGSRFTFYRDTEWSHVLIKEHFDGFQAYKTELLVLSIGVVALVVISISLWTWRFVRSWWAGIVSIAIPVAACVTFALLELAREYLKITLVAGLASVVIVVIIESWRQRPRLSSPSMLPLNLHIPAQKRSVSVLRRWKASSSDDPITEWQDDIVGRAAVVETLAEHALRLNTPVVALNGEFGDGKSSVLNLLKKFLKGQAIVVLFNAWLPGSEATLVTDLFINIATECKKHFYVPQLRKQTLAYARTLTRSVSFLAGLRELLPTQSQWEDVQELHQSFSRLPRRIVVPLDEIDRMQRDELLVFLKIQQLETKLSQHLARVEGNLEDMRRRKAKLETELRNLTGVIAGGMDSPSLRQGITEREAEISALTAKTLGRGKNSVHTLIRDLRKRVVADLGDLRALVSTRDNAPAMRMELAKHVKEIVMLPGQEAGEIKYKGKWDLLGDGGRRECAEGQNRTGYAGLFRAALYR
jgi:hypothetical protein